MFYNFSYGVTQEASWEAQLKDKAKPEIEEYSRKGAKLAKSEDFVTLRALRFCVRFN